MKLTSAVRSHTMTSVASLMVEELQSLAWYIKGVFPFIDFVFSYIRRKIQFIPKKRNLLFSGFPFS